MSSLHIEKWPIFSLQKDCDASCTAFFESPFSKEKRDLNLTSRQVSRAYLFHTACEKGEFFHLLSPTKREKMAEEKKIWCTNHSKSRAKCTHLGAIFFFRSYRADANFFRGGGLCGETIKSDERIFHSKTFQHILSLPILTLYLTIII